MRMKGREEEVVEEMGMRQSLGDDFAKKGRGKLSCF